MTDTEKLLDEPQPAPVSVPVVALKDLTEEAAFSLSCMGGGEVAVPREVLDWLAKIAHDADDTRSEEGRYRLEITVSEIYGGGE